MQFRRIVYICIPFAGVVELVDTLDLGSSAARCESSSLSACTKVKALRFSKSFFYGFYPVCYLVNCKLLFIPKGNVIYIGYLYTHKMHACWDVYSEYGLLCRYLLNTTPINFARCFSNSCMFSSLKFMSFWSLVFCNLTFSKISLFSN